MEAIFDLKNILHCFEEITYAQQMQDTTFL